MKNRNCTEVMSHSKIKIEENGKKAIFRNDGKEVFSVTRIDGCIIKEGPRADFLVSNKETTSVFVELKGADVSHACLQLFTSIENKSVQPLLNKNVGFLIV